MTNFENLNEKAKTIGENPLFQHGSELLYMYDKKEILAREMWDYLQSILRALTNSVVEKRSNLVW